MRPLSTHAGAGAVELLLPPVSSAEPPAAAALHQLPSASSELHEYEESMVDVAEVDGYETVDAAVDEHERLDGIVLGHAKEDAVVDESSPQASDFDDDPAKSDPPLLEAKPKALSKTAMPSLPHESQSVMSGA